MKELVKVTEAPGGGIVEARELHLFLESSTKFATWIERRIEEYGFVEGQDFMVFLKNGKNSKGGRPLKEYSLSLDMAKELAMVERTEKGRMARQYFIEIEKRYRRAVNAIGADIDLLRRAVIVAGSQARLSRRIGISEGTMSDMLSGNKALSSGLIARVESACRMVVERGMYPEPETIENLMKVEDKEVRLSLYETMKKGGLL